MRSEVPGRRYHPGIDEPEAVGMDRRPLVYETKAETDRRTAQVVSEYASMIHKGYDETIDLNGALYNPQFLTNIRYNVVQFTMPDGMVGYIDQIALIFSEPVLAQCGVWNWMLTVNDGLVPYCGDVNTLWNTAGIGEIARPLKIAPVWIQSGQAIALTIYSAVGLVYLTESYTIHGRMAGGLFKPASALLGVAHG